MPHFSPPARPGVESYSECLAALPFGPRAVLKSRVFSDFLHNVLELANEMLVTILFAVPAIELLPSPHARFWLPFPSAETRFLLPSSLPPDFRCVSNECGVVCVGF